MGLLGRREPAPYSQIEEIVAIAEALDLPVPDTAVGTDPRKRTTGTSYNASGYADPTPKDKVELGSARTGTIRDVVPALANRATAARVYQQMSDGDAAVDVGLRATKMPIVGADFFVEPWDNQQQNLEIKDLVEYNILHSTSSPWLSLLQDILRMLEQGFSVGEKVYEDREWTPKRKGANRKTYTMLKKIGPRLAPTIKEILYDDNGGPKGVVHNALREDGKPEEVEIDVGKLVIFTNNKLGGNLEGKSILRTAYKHWFYKDELYKIDAIQKERHGMGFPILKPPPTATTADLAAGLTLVENIRTNERAGAVLPFGWELDFAQLTGQPVNVMGSIDHHNGMIMLNVMTQFLLMGVSESGGGARATAGSHQDMFTKSTRYVANLICDMFNLYVIPQLVAYNFKTDSFPQLKVRNIGETKDLQQWASAISALAAQNLITLDLETEQWVRSKIDAPLKLGDVQTPEANATSTKGAEQSGNKGNSGAPTDQAG